MSNKTSFDTNNKGFATKCIHAGAVVDPASKSVQTPIYQTAAFEFNDADHAARLFALQEGGNVYSRLTNPTVSALQARIAALEGGTGATAASSGHSAQFMALLTFMEPDDHVVASSRVYGGTFNQFKRTFKQFGWQSTQVIPDDINNFKNAITPKTKAIFIEGLANPGGVVVDIEGVAKIAHEAGIPLIVDNTMASPYLCQPIKWGADVVVHSTTKFLSGNGTTMGGVAVEGGNFDWKQNDKFRLLTEPEAAYNGVKFYETFGNMAMTMSMHGLGLRDIGACQSPFNAFITLLGIETLPLRMEKHVSNAMKVAEFLESHSAVSFVSYASLKSSKYYDLAKKYMPKGAGSVFTVGLKGGYDAGQALVENLKMFHHLANIGDARSLIIHPASTTHKQLPDEQKTAAGIGPEVVRLSIGLEDAEDIMADLDQALTSKAYKQAA